MSIALMSKVYTLAVDQDTREILMCLADYANDDGSSVKPSIARIAWKIGDGSVNENGEYKNIRTVQRRMKELVSQKALIVIEKSGFHKPTEYRLDLSVFESKSKFVPKGDNLSFEKGDKIETKGDKKDEKGDTAMSSDPSIDPSINNIIETKTVSIPPTDNLSGSEINLSLGESDNQLQLRAFNMPTVSGIHYESEEKPKEEKYVLTDSQTARYLSAQKMGKWGHQWKGFSSAKQRDTWKKMDSLYEFKTVKEKIDYFVSLGIAPKKIAERVISAVTQNCKEDKRPEPVRHDNSVSEDVTFEIPKPKFGVRNG